MKTLKNKWDVISIFKKFFPELFSDNSVYFLEEPKLKYQDGFYEDFIWEYQVVDKRGAKPTIKFFHYSETKDSCSLKETPSDCKLLTKEVTINYDGPWDRRKKIRAFPLNGGWITITTQNLCCLEKNKNLCFMFENEMRYRNFGRNVAEVSESSIEARVSGGKLPIWMLVSGSSIYGVFLTGITEYWAICSEEVFPKVPLYKELPLINGSNEKVYFDGKNFHYVPFRTLEKY